MSLLLAIALVVLAADPFDLEGVRVIDGDTIHAEKVHLGYGVVLLDQTIRADDSDAFETSKRRTGIHYHPNEIELGKKAAAGLKQFCEKAEKVRVFPANGNGRDQYGRLLGKIICVYPVKDMPGFYDYADFAGFLQKHNLDRRKWEASQRGSIKTSDVPMAPTLAP